MNLKKYQKGYLGTTDATLDERVAQRCGGTIIPTPTMLLGVPADNLASDTGRKNPKVAALDATRALVLYSNTGQTVLYYRVITIDGEGQASWGTEGTLLSSVGFITSWGLCNIYDTKVFIGYKHATGGTNTIGDVGTVDGSGNMTFATPTNLDTTHTPDSNRAWLEVVKIEDGTAVISAPNTDNIKAGVQIIDVDVSDNITFGTVAKTSGTNKSTQKIAMLDTTTGIVNCGGTFTNSLATSEEFTISGTTPTFNGTEYIFTNTTQYPTETDQFFIGDAVAISSTQQMLTGSSTVNDGVDTFHGISNMQCSDASGVITSATVLQDLTGATYTSAPTSATLSTELLASGDMIILAVSQFGTPNILSLIRHSTASTPVYQEHQTVASNTQVSTPDTALLGTDRSAHVWTENDGLDTWIGSNGAIYNL